MRSWEAAAMPKAKDPELERGELQAAYDRAVDIAWETPLDTPAFRRNRLEVERLWKALHEAEASPAAPADPKTSETVSQVDGAPE
jgi:hypothetical protein